MSPHERFLPLSELKRHGFALDHAATGWLLLFTGARSLETIGLRWD